MQREDERKSKLLRKNMPERFGTREGGESVYQSVGSKSLMMYVGERANDQAIKRKVKGTKQATAWVALSFSKRSSKTRSW